MIALADLLKNGTEGLDADPARAPQLYEPAMDEDGDAFVMNRFASFLKDAPSGDPKRAVRL